jgi:hypothetical protein
MTNQSREPKGTETGGQFAASVNPESTVVLDDETGSITIRPDLVGNVVRATGLTRDGFDGVLSAEQIASTRYISDDDDGWAYLQLGDEVVMVKSECLILPNKSAAALVDVGAEDKFEYELSDDDSPDKKHDHRFFSCDACGEIRFDVECEVCGAPTRSLSGETARDLGLLDDEEQNDEDEAHYCPTCETYTDSAEAICADCGNEMREPTRAEAKAKYRAAISKEFSVFGSDPIVYRPNDYGCELLTDSSISISNEISTSDGGVMWVGELRIGHKRLSVENRGDGGSNIYRPIFDRAAGDDEKSAAWMVEDELTKRVHKGFDGLQSSEALDDFCSIVEIVGEAKS